MPYHRATFDNPVPSCTILYMNVQDFRSNLKSCFDEALKGNAVLIERGGVTYKLVADIVIPPTDEAPKTVSKKPPVIHKVEAREPLQMGPQEKGTVPPPISYKETNNWGA